MGNQYRRMQTVKHALQYYITRPNANEKDLVREKEFIEVSWRRSRNLSRKKSHSKERGGNKMIKYCPDLTGFEIRESYLRGGGTNKTVILNHCLKRFMRCL